MDENIEGLVGKSVIGFEQLSETSAKLLISDGIELEVSCNPEPDCCGYNDFNVVIPDGFDFEDNIIVKVEDKSYDNGGEDSGNVSLGIFTNHLGINIEGYYGSGSGWSYGQFVDIQVHYPGGD